MYGHEKPLPDGPPDYLFSIGGSSIVGLTGALRYVEQAGRSPFRDCPGCEGGGWFLESGLFLYPLWIEDSVKEDFDAALQDKRCELTAELNMALL